MGLSAKDIRKRFKEQGVELGGFNPLKFTTFKSEVALKAPNYNLGVDITNPTESAKPEAVISENLGDTIQAVLDSPSQVQSTYLGLINRYWDTEELGGVEVTMTNGENDITVTIGGEDYPVEGVYGRSSMEVWQEIKNIEAKVRKIQDAKRSGGSPGTGEGAGTDTSQY